MNVVLQVLLMGRGREVSSDSQYNSWFDHENAVLGRRPRAASRTASVQETIKPG